MYIKSKLISKWGENVVTLCLWLCLKRDALDYCFWQWQVSDKKLLGNNHALCCQCNINIQTAHLCPRLDKISKVSTYTIFCVANIEMHRDTLLKIVFSTTKYKHRCDDENMGSHDFLSYSFLCINFFVFNSIYVLIQKLSIFYALSLN